MDNVQEITVNQLNGSIILDSDSQRVHIKDLTLYASDAYNYLNQFQNATDREKELQKIIELGVAVIQKVNLVSDTDYFDKRIEQLANKFEKQIEGLQDSVLEVVEKNFDPNEAKSYTRQLNDFFKTQKDDISAIVKETKKELNTKREELENIIDENFDSDDKTSHLGKLIESIGEFDKSIFEKFNPDNKNSVIAKLNDKLEKIFADSGTLNSVLEKHISTKNTDSPLYKFKEEIKTEISELKTELAKSTAALQAREEIVQKSPENGYVFEDAVFDELQRIAKSHSDIVEDVSKTTGDTCGKKGDFTYQITEINKLIVIEAKSTPITSIQTALNTLHKSIENRHADYGIYLVENEDHLQKQVGIWQEYPDNMIITHYTLLEVAIKVARMRLKLEKQNTNDINAQEINNEVKKVECALKKFTSLKTKLTSIRSTSESIDTIVDELKHEIAESLGNITNELNKSS